MTIVVKESIDVLFTLLEIHLFDPFLHSKEYPEVVIEDKSLSLRTSLRIIVPTFSKLFLGH